MYSVEPYNRQQFSIASQSSRKDNDKSLCEVIRSTLSPETSNLSVLGLPVPRRGRVVLVEGEYDSAGLRSVFRRHLLDIPKDARQRLRVISFQDDHYKERLPERLIPWLFDWKDGMLMPTRDWTRLQCEVGDIDGVSLLILDPLWALIAGMPCLPHADFSRQLARRLRRDADRNGFQIIAFP